MRLSLQDWPIVFQVLWLLAPELLLLVTALLLLALDLSPLSRRNCRCAYVALAGLGLALAAAALQWGVNQRIFNVLVDDPFAVTVKIIALFAGGMVVLLADTYLKQRRMSLGLFYALVLIAVLAICLLTVTVNLILIFLALDFLSITFYILTAYLRDDGFVAEAAIKYFIYGGVLSAVMLFGLSWLYGATATTDLVEIAAILAQQGDARHAFAMTALLLFGAGVAFKLAIAPFHQWAPDVYEGAPTPVTAFISVGPKLAGFALLVRFTLLVLPVGAGYRLPNDWQAFLLTLAVFTMFVGNLTALWQTNIKRLLAYSSIAQVGYILIGVTAESPRGVTAVLFYLAAYALTNLCIFAGVVAVSNQLGSDDIADYAGLHKRAPWLAASLLFGLFSLVGIPATAGFVGKLWLFASALEAGFVWLAVLGVLNSVLSLGYYWQIIRVIYILPPRSETPLRVGWMLAAALAVTVSGILLGGVLPHLILPVFEAAAQTFF